MAETVVQAQLPGQPAGTRRLPESALLQQHPGKSGNADISDLAQRADIFPSDRCPPVRYGYKSGNVLAPWCDFQRVLSWLLASSHRTQNSLHGLYQIRKDS